MDSGLAEYGAFIKEIKDLIYRRQYEAMKAVNKELMHLYWEIGVEIDRKQREQGWGKSVVEILAKELQKEFPGVQGFSARNLWLMRSFYLEISQMPNLQPMVAESHAAILPPLVAEISWTKNVIIMQKCKDPVEREFYIKMTKRFGWTKDVLINNIENRVYEKFLINQTNFDDTVAEKYKLQAKLAVKDDYNFEFIEMGAQHSEAELSAGIMKNIRAFLDEMGGYFTLVRDQYHLDVDDDESYLDLLLYHRRLRCLVAIELKIGEFKAEYAGKMLYYLSVLDETVKLPDENESIGIIICKNKKRTRVEYTLRKANAPIGVATYSHHDNLPEGMRGLLPSPDEIANIVAGIDEEEQL